MTSLHRLTKKLFRLSILAVALLVAMVLYVFSSTEHLTRLGGLFNNTGSVPQAFSPTPLDSPIKTRALNISTMTHAPLKEKINISHDERDPGQKQNKSEVALKEECQENIYLLGKYYEVF